VQPPLSTSRQRAGRQCTAFRVDPAQQLRVCLSLVVGSWRPWSTLSLATHCCAAPGAEAFTTSGTIIKTLLPQQQWRHCSFHPAQGMYVHRTAVAYGRLQPPAEHHDLQLEPQVPSNQRQLPSTSGAQPQAQEGPASSWPPVKQYVNWANLGCSSFSYVLLPKTPKPHN